MLLLLLSCQPTPADTAPPAETSQTEAPSADTAAHPEDTRQPADTREPFVLEAWTVCSSTSLGSGRSLRRASGS